MRIMFFKDGEVRIRSAHGLGEVSSHSQIMHQLARLVIETSFDAEETGAKYADGKEAVQVWNLDHVCDYLEEWKTRFATGNEEPQQEIKEEEKESWELVFEKPEKEKPKPMPTHLL